jgi:3-hydroxyisobutyrate dehydrogenase
VLGTGIMGAAMARNLLGAGHPVRVWNRTRARAEPLAGDGAIVCDTPREAAAGADAAITMLRDGPAVRGALDDGALASLRKSGGALVQMATVGIEAAEELGRVAQEAGVPYVDAPVLGTKAPAEEGKLVVLASGPDELRTRVAPLFDAVGQRTMWVGSAGGGTRLKIVVQNWIASVMEGLAETVALARATGVDPDSFLDAIEGGALGPPYARIKGRMMIDGEYPVSFPLEGMEKDVRLVLDAARSHGLEPGLAPVVLERVRLAIERGHGEDDMAAIYEGSAPR